MQINCFGEVVVKNSKLLRSISITLFVLSGINLLCSICGFLLPGLQSDTSCSFLLVMGIIELVIAVILNKKYKKLLKKEANFAKALEASKQFMTERKNLYLHWLDENAFICSKQIGNLLFDFFHKKFCYIYTRKIYEFSDTIGVECHKTKRQQHEGSGSSDRNYFGHGYRNSKYSSHFGTSHGNRRYSSSTIDTSTYDVHVKTSRLDSPLIVFSCGTSYDLANEITSMLQLIIDSPDVPFNGTCTEQIQINEPTPENDVAMKKFMEKSLFWAAGQLPEEEFQQEKEKLLYLEIT